MAVSRPSDDINSELRKLLESLSLFGQVPRSRTRDYRGPTGFDAKITRELFIKKAIANPVTSKNKPILVLNNIKYYANCQPKEDLLLFIQLFLKYGNNIQKVLRELKLSSIVRRKCALYGISIEKQSHLKQNQLTLSRIARAYPLQTAFCIVTKKIQGILPYSALFKQELPLVMQHNIFPGLIPAKKFTKELREITLILNMEISMILSKPRPNPRHSVLFEWDWGMEEEEKTVEEIIQGSAKYVDAGINNDIDDDKKIKVLVVAGILEENANGEIELSAATVMLVNKLAAIKEVYSLTYSGAIDKLNSEKIQEIM